MSKNKETFRKDSNQKSNPGSNKKEFNENEKAKISFRKRLRNLKIIRI